LSSYLIAIKQAPLLNTPDFVRIFGGNALPLDEQGLLRALEMIALPGTKFQVLEFLDPIAKVITPDYPHGPVYIDTRFTRPATANCPERLKSLPPKEVILARLEKSLGLPYIWGGNWGRGVPEISSYYQSNIPSHLEAHWPLQGVDCSGLLYEATSGATPRNTSQLLTFGEKIADKNLSLEKICSVVKPLDMILWPGHVIIVFNSTTSIESLQGKGVILQDLKKRLFEAPSFVIRRFI